MDETPVSVSGREPLLARRIPSSEVRIGDVYLIHARNGGVGVAMRDDGALGYQLHREKFGEHFLFVEYDWDEGEPYGTAIPLRALPGSPPEDEQQRLQWLAEREEEHAEEIAANWQTVLGALRAPRR
jgi:hypothetical protein